MKIIAEVRNKYNTTKGNHRTELYDAIKSKLNTPEFKDFVGYYVEIISKGKNKYDKTYTPSDNKTKKRRPENERIRVIDGVSFYALATGREHALQELFGAIPGILAEKYQHKLGTSEAKQYFELFEKAFTTE